MSKRFKAFATAAVISNINTNKLPPMEQNNITTDSMNETIAIFDGRDLKDDGEGVAILVKNHKTRYHFELKYHESWDALMPVVEKIENMPASIRVENQPNQMDKNYLVTIWIDPEDEPIIQICKRSKIEAVHKAVYQFITWYNQQTTNE